MRRKLRTAGWKLLLQRSDGAERSAGMPGADGADRATGTDRSAGISWI